MRIVQLLTTLSFGDAVGNDTLAIRQMLEDMGCETEVYAESIDSRLPAGCARPFREMGELKPEDILIYHGSTGTPLNGLIPRMGGKKVMIYHNITPSSFFMGYSPRSYLLTEQGYREISALKDTFDRCIADSKYNRQDLLKMGYSCPIDVCPIMIPFRDYDREPDEAVMARYRSDGWTNLLFVGRIAPNKRQEDVIKAFCCYHRYYNPKSRLFLVGNASGMEAYQEQLEQYAKTLGVAGHVLFSGHISFRSILAYYHLADAFVCMSEHEGFCVPVVEAMYFGVPIVAYAAAAVPDTLGGGGLLLQEKDPLLAAAMIDRVVRDGQLRAYLREKQKEKLREYDHGAVRKQMKEILDKVIAE